MSQPGCCPFVLSGDAVTLDDCIVQRELVKVRKAGYAVDDEEGELAVHCVAVPVMQNGRFAAALSVAGAASQLQLDTIDEIARELRATALAISAPADRP